MTSGPTFRGSRWALALALPLPPLAWYGVQQGVGFAVRVGCSLAPGPGVLAGLVALVGCFLAIWLSVGAGPDGEAPAGQTNAVLRSLVRLGAGVFALAIVYQTLAVLIVPPCAR